MNKNTQKRIRRDTNSNNVLATTLLTAPNYDGTPSFGTIGSMGFDATNNNFIGHDNTGWIVLGGTAGPTSSINFMASVLSDQIITSSGETPVIFVLDNVYPCFNNTSGAYNAGTGIFTAPQNGKYLINVVIGITTSSPPSGTFVVAYLKLNNTIKLNEQPFQYNSSIQFFYKTSIILDLIAGNTVNMVIFKLDANQVQVDGNNLNGIVSTFSISLL